MKKNAKTSTHHNTNQQSLKSDNIRPTCGGVFAAEIVFDGVGKNLGFAVAVAGGVLLRPQYHRLGAVQAVDARNAAFNTHMHGVQHVPI